MDISLRINFNCLFCFLYVVAVISAQSSTSVLEEIADAHVFGGTLITSIREVQLCIDACKNKDGCTSLDFDFSANTCWHHTSLCRDVTAKRSCTHYRLVTCERNKHIRGGVFQGFTPNVTACLLGCKQSGLCVGVDYNFIEQSCWYHDVGTVCNELIDKANCVHFKQVNCTVLDQNGMVAPVVSQHPGVHIRGAEYRGVFDTIGDCIRACQRAGLNRCKALDYDVIDTVRGTCWFHNATSCGTFRERISATHIKFIFCDASTPVTQMQTTTTTTTTTTAPTTTIPATTAPAPTNALTNAPTTIALSPIPVPEDLERPVRAQFPLYHGIGGSLQPSIQTEQACVAECQGTCEAVDFDSSDSSCWFHTSNTSCNTLESKPSCTHTRKVVCISALPCGSQAIVPRLDSRIVGGVDAIANSWPWQVAMMLKGSANPNCGGTLIHENFVMTAAHCVTGSSLTSTPSNWDVILGEHNTRVEEGPEVTCSITQIFVHPNWNSKPFDYDVALLKISCDYEQSDEISNSCLPGPNITFNAGDNCVVTGWGLLAEDGSQPTVLNQARVPLLSREGCRSVYGPQGITITNRMLCAGFTEGGVDACNGDSGGPLMCQVGTVWYVAGIVSFGIGCARQRAPGVYTDVASVTPWIQGIIAQNA